MGALTDNRKRCFVDLCLPAAVSTPLPPSKKTKLQPPEPPEPPEVASSPAFRRFPPVAPLPRTVHAPQRIIRAFGLGSSKPRPKPFDFNMGGHCSTFAKSFLRKDNRSHENLGLEDYKRLVSGHETVEKVSSLPRQFSPPVSDLTVLTREEDDEKPKSVVLNRKIEDVRKVGLEVTPQVARNWVARKEPLYKELYETSTRKHGEKLSSLELEVKITESKLSGIRFSQLDKKPTKDLQGVFALITDEDDSQVYEALHSGYSNEILVTHEGTNITITREILRCLSCGAWLNDEVINVYLELLKEREIREPKKFLTCHFFNTFFYKKLVSGRNGYDYKAVRRWTSQRKIGYSLVECDKIFVPIHKEVHWCLAVINVKDEKLQYLDSLGGMDTNVLRVLARYFMDEAKDKSDKQVDTTSWTQEMVEDLPLQQNGWDCGMFMLKYADFYSRGLELCFGQEHMNYFRKRTALEILRLRAN